MQGLLELKKIKRKEEEWKVIYWLQKEEKKKKKKEMDLHELLEVKKPKQRR